MKMPSSSFLFVSLLCAILATSINAQSRASCPSSQYMCSCYIQSPGIRLSCDGYYNSPEEIKRELEIYKPYGPIVSLTITSITQSKFSYVVDDFLSGNQIPDVTFACSHSHSVNSGHLTFSAYAFADSTGKCGLTGNLTFSACNIRQFYSPILNNCNQLEKLAFMDSHVDNMIEIPTLESLRNFTVYYPQMWNYASQRGLSRFSLARDAQLPRLRYLDLSGNSLTDDEIAFIPELTTIEEMHLEGNYFSVMPILINFTNLHIFSLTLNGSITEVSIQLPNPRTQSRSLIARFYSSSSTKIYNVTSLQGTFAYSNDKLYLNILMDEFSEDVFLAPLKSGLNVILNPASRFQCGCKISWLVRDNPELLSQVSQGYCTDSRPFQSIGPEEVVCCSNESLIKRVGRQEKEIDRLQSAVKQLRSAMESREKTKRLSEL